MKESYSIFRFLSRLAGGFDRNRSHLPAGRDQPERPRLLLVVEGRHDIEFLCRISAILHAADHGLPDLADVERLGKVIFVPAGGGDFRPWLTRFSALGCDEFHLYDREIPPESQRREQWAAMVNSRPGCRACVTGKRSLENYLHPEAIRDARGLALAFSDTDDVPELAARATFVPQDGAVWQKLTRRAQRRLRGRAKIWLNTIAVERMTSAHLAECDPQAEVASWLWAIGELLARSH